ncbi:MAG TPA: hypothetical protein VEU55_05470 [Gemmatimonadales bacterium]|nr:hypothetical protein [Gemmatimonadales bacterium]
MSAGAARRTAGMSTPWNKTAAAPLRVGIGGIPSVLVLDAGSHLII